MIIKTFRLKGMLRFKDEIAVDLRPLPAGLIAFVGPNGEGKTSLLEAPFGTLYRELPSRSDRELLDYAVGRDSFMETTFAVDGQGDYRARVNLDGPKRVSDAVLEQTVDGVVSLIGDGRVKAYDDAIADRFPPAALVLASAFAAQNRRGSFVTLGKKERRDLFAQLLGAERYEAMSVTARTAASNVEQGRVRLQAQREVLARETSDRILLDLDQQVNALEGAQARADGEKATVLKTVADLETRLATMQDAVAAYAAVTQRLTTLSNEQAMLQAERRGVDVARERLTTDHAAALEQLSRKLASDLKLLALARTEAGLFYEADSKAIDAKLTTDLKDIDERLAGNRTLNEKSAGIRAAVAAIASLDERLGLLRADSDSADRALAVHRQTVKVAELELTQFDAVSFALTRAKADAELLGQVPCGGRGEFAACRFLTNAQASQQQIPNLERQAAQRELVASRVTAVREELHTREQIQLDLKNAIRPLEAEKTQHQALAKYADALAAAEARIEELTDTRARLILDAAAAQQAAVHRRDTAVTGYNARRPQIELEAATANQLAEERHARAEADLDARTRALGTRLQSIDIELTEAEADRDGLAEKHERVITLQTQLRDARAQWDYLTAQLATLAANIEDVGRRRAELEAKRGRYVDVCDRIAQLDTELVEWQRLTEALGREGLPTLEIDAAGPTVSGHCNDLMNVAFGPRFTLELVTEQAKKDGKGTKEVFSIQVLDNARGGEVRDIADLSGGEQVIVDEALKNALCIYMNQRALMPLRTCWRDETTGPLDAENAPRYVQMLRRVQELAGFHQILYVTHNPEAAALADAQLYVHAGRVDVRLPPFSEAA